MILSTLLLTISTCMSSGAANIAQANRIDSIKEQAVQIVIDAVDGFDYSNFEFRYEEYESAVKEKLYSFNKENNLIDDFYGDGLAENLKNDLSYISTVDFGSIILTKNLSNLNLSEEVTIAKNSKFNFNEIIQNEVIIDNISKLNFNLNSNFTNIVSKNNDDKNSSNNSTVDKSERFPIYSYNAAKMKTYLNGKVGGKTFIGIAASKDSCIAFYNMVAGWLNNMAFYKASGIKEPAGIIYEAVKTLTLVTAGTALGAAITSVVSLITAYFIGLWV